MGNSVIDYERAETMLSGIQELWLGFFADLLHLLVVYIGTLLGLSV
jgi:hypothetical protein